MLSSTVYRDLTLIIRHIHLIQTRLDEGAPPTEIDLIVEAARDRVRRLAETIDATDSESVQQLIGICTGSPTGTERINLETMQVI